MTRTPLALGAAALVAAGSFVLAQEVTSVTEDHGTVGDVLVVAGTGLKGRKGKPKVFLTPADQVGKKGKKQPSIKLKVGAFDETSIEAEIKRVSKKTPAGLYDVHVKAKGQDELVLPGGFRLVGPTVQSADPDVAAPGDTVDVLVDDYGTRGSHSVEVAFQSARIQGEQDLGGGEWRVSVQVPDVAAGLWPVSVTNSVGSHTLLGALEVQTDDGEKPKGAWVGFDLLRKPFKAKEKDIALDEQDGVRTNVGAVGGSKGRPQIFGISVESPLADLEVGDVFGPDTGSLQYDQTKKKGKTLTAAWSTTSNDPAETFAIGVAARDDECITFVVVGTLSRAFGDGPENLEVAGYVTAPLADPIVAPKLCEPLTTATGSVTGEFVSEEQKNIALAGLSGPRSFRFSTGEPDNLDGVPESVITWNVDFDPRNDAVPVTYDGIDLSGGGLTNFSLQLADNTFWNQVIGVDLKSSMSVTITEVVDVPNNQLGILACIRGTFTGVLRKADASLEEQTFTGTFEIPWYDTGFGQR